MVQDSWSPASPARLTAVWTGIAAASPLTRIEAAGGVCVVCGVCQPLPCPTAYAVGLSRQGGGMLTHPSRWSAAALAGCTTVVATRATVQPLGLQGICMCMLNGCHAGCRAMLHHFNVVALLAVLQCRSLGLHGLACSTGSMPEAVGPLRCT